MVDKPKSEKGMQNSGWYGAFLIPGKQMTL